MIVGKNVSYSLNSPYCSNLTLFSFSSSLLAKPCYPAISFSYQMPLGTFLGISLSWLLEKICCCFLFISFKLVCFQGCCIGQGTYSDLANSGLDVQSLVSLPESDDDSAIEADDIEVKEKEGGNTTQANAVKAKVRNFIIVCQPLLIIHMWERVENCFTALFCHAMNTRKGLYLCAAGRFNPLNPNISRYR